MLLFLDLKDDKTYMMAEWQSSDKIKKWKTSITIEQLPEQIFREIYDFLGVKTIFMVVRNVSKKFREHADSYIDVKGIFMMIGNEHDKAKIIYIFNRRAAKFDVFCEHAPISVFSTPISSSLIFTGTRILGSLDLIVTTKDHNHSEHLMFDME